MSRGKGPDGLKGTVRAAIVNEDDLVVEAAQNALHLVEERVDIAFLVVGRDDDGYQRISLAHDRLHEWLGRSGRAETSAAQQGISSLTYNTGSLDLLKSIWTARHE